MASWQRRKSRFLHWRLVKAVGLWRLVGFEIGGLLRGIRDEGWMIDGLWICPKAPKLGSLYKQMPGRMIFEWMLTGRSWWVQPRFGWLCLGWLFSDGCKAWDLKKMFTTLLRAWWGRIHAEFFTAYQLWFVVIHSVSILNPRYLHPFLAGIFSSWVVVNHTFPVEPVGGQQQQRCRFPRTKIFKSSGSDTKMAASWVTQRCILEVGLGNQFLFGKNMTGLVGKGMLWYGTSEL